MQFSNFESLLLYLGVYIFSSGCLALCVRIKNKAPKIFFYCLSAMAVVIFAAIRHDVGTDYDNYTIIYESASKMAFTDWLAEFDFSATPFGCLILSKIASWFNSVEVFFGLFAFVIFLPVSLTILRYRQSIPVFLTTFAFLTTLFTSGLNVMKQAAAVSIVLFSVRFLTEKKTVKFIFFAVLAACFHPTAICVMPLCLFSFKKGLLKNSFSFRKKLILVAYVIALLLMPVVLRSLGGRFEGYLNGGERGNNYSFVLSLLWLIIFLMCRKVLTAKNSNNDLYLFIFMIGVLLESLGFTSPYIKRISLYFSSISVFIVPQIYNAFVREEKKVVWTGILIYYILLFTLSYYVLGHSDIIPYAVR